MENDIIDSYFSNDYVVIKNFFPQEVISSYINFIKNALQNDVEQVFNHWGASVFAKDTNQKVQDLLKDTSNIPINDQQVLLGQFPINIRLSDAIMPVAEFIGKSSLVQEILKSQNLYMHMPPMVRFVPPGYSSAAVPAHQDISYNRHMSNFVTIWTPMVSITDVCGGLVMYEGSQHLPEAITEEKRADSWLPPIDVSDYKRNQLIGLDVGDIVILSSRIAHESAANTSDKIRLSMDLRVFGEQETSTKHCIDLKKMEIIERKAA
ncbi:MAG: phytanoyl-CoA dioxygenase family protein [Pseudomonadota bacterium]